jgi:hypothetical protein
MEGDIAVLHQGIPICTNEEKKEKKEKVWE